MQERATDAFADAVGLDEQRNQLRWVGEVETEIPTGRLLISATDTFPSAMSCSETVISGVAC